MIKLNLFVYIILIYISISANVNNLKIIVENCMIRTKKKHISKKENRLSAIMKQQ